MELLHLTIMMLSSLHCVFGQTSGCSGELPYPYIRTKCSTAVGEKSGVGFCLDPPGKDPPFNWEFMSAHSCKCYFTKGYHLDMGWAFSNICDNDDFQIGMIQGVSSKVQGKCIAANADQTAIIGVDCTDATQYSLFAYYQESGHFRFVDMPFGSITSDYCDSASSSSSSSSENDGVCITVDNTEYRETGRDKEWNCSGCYRIGQGLGVLLNECEDDNVYQSWEVVEDGSEPVVDSDDVCSESSESPESTSG